MYSFVCLKHLLFVAVFSILKDGILQRGKGGKKELNLTDRLSLWGQEVLPTSTLISKLIKSDHALPLIDVQPLKEDIRCCVKVTWNNLAWYPSALVSSFLCATALPSLQLAYSLNKSEMTWQSPRPLLWNYRNMASFAATAGSIS